MTREHRSRAIQVEIIAIACLLISSGIWTAQALEPRTRLNQYAHKAWQIGDAGLLGTPQSIAQTQDGYIWVSTSNGLFRFDGVRFVKWMPAPGESLPSNSLWFLFGARDGSLYVGTDRGLARITSGHVYNYPDSPRWPGPFVEDAMGNVWMGVSGAHSRPSPLCKIGKTELQCLGSREGLSCTRGLADTIGADGYLWIGSQEGTCRWKEGAAPEHQEIPALRKQNGLNAVRSLASLTDGTLWAGTQNAGMGEGLLQLDHGTWKTFMSHGIDGSQFSVSALLAGKSGALWIGTTDRGLYRLLDGKLDHIDTENGLTGRRILSILQDREGDLWLVTPMGVDYFRDYAVQSFTSNEGLLDDRARAVAVDGTGSLYLGSATLSRLRNGNLEQIKDSRGKPLHDIQFLFADSSGALWIAAANQMFTLRRGQLLTEISSFSNSASEIVVCITEDQEHNIWVSSEDLKTHHSYLNRIHNGTVTGRFDPMPVLGDQVMNAMSPSLDGDLWIGGASHGLYSFHGGRFQRVPADGFDDRVENLLQEPNGGLWLVTPKGFIRYENGKARRLDTASGLPCDGGVNIQDDHDGSKWFYMHCGILQVADTALSSWWKHFPSRILGRFFDGLDGAMPSLFEGSPAQTSSGELWSATGYDFQFIDRKHLPFNSTIPPVHVEMIVADEKNYLPTHSIRLPPQTHEIQIDYTGLSFRIPERVRFRYRLSRHDKSWVEAGTRRQAFYNDLRPGHYLFEVVCRNNDGVWNNEAGKVSIDIQPTWYQTTLFRNFAILLGTLLVIIAYYLRLSRYATKLRIRFDERLEERTRLARDLHDTLLQTIQGSKLVADSARGHAENPDSTIRSLDRLSEWLDRAIEEGRQALEALRSSVDESDSLTAVIRRAGDACTFDSQMKATVFTHGVDQELHPIAREEIYRIVFEAIRNACVHSGGTELKIELHYKRRFLELNICDNGRGMDTDALQIKAGHFGVIGMRERAVSLHGTLSITSTRDLGTCVSLRVPGTAAYLRKSWLHRVWMVKLRRQIVKYLKLND